MAFVEALGAAKTAYDFVALAIKARDDLKIQEAMSDLREKLWDMSSNGLSQLQSLHSLELEAQKLRMELAEAKRAQSDLEAKIEEEAQYQLAEIRTGIWAYLLVSDIDKPVESRPHFCPACYANGKKVPMRYFKLQGELAETWRCELDWNHELRAHNTDATATVLGHDPRR